jgi:hypothetical protein
MLRRPLLSPTPSRPPGFSASSRTPTFHGAGSAGQTPASDATSIGTALPEELQPLFVLEQPPLLQMSSTTPPPRRPIARRKTLAIHRTGFTFQRPSTRNKCKRRVVPVAGEAETLVCKNLGIIQDGQLVTQQVLDEFSEKFKNAASSDTITSLHLLFKLDEPQDLAVEAALLSRGGAEALEQFGQDGETQVPDA